MKKDPTNFNSFEAYDCCNFLMQFPFIEVFSAK